MLLSHLKGKSQIKGVEMLQKKGFTLIELLVVIAIIAILLGILLPALTRAKMIAEDVICKTNLHQYQLATKLYANDNNDRYPEPWECLYKNGELYPGDEGGCRWHNPLIDLQEHPEYAGSFWPYIKSTKAGLCPTFRRIAPKYGSSHTGGSCIGSPYTAQYSYSLNVIFDAGIKENQVKSHPSKTLLWGEENMWLLVDSDRSTILSRSVLNDNSLCISPNGGGDGLGSFHKISSGKLAVQRSSKVTISGRTYSIYNGGSSNIILMDGSVISATPPEGPNYRGR